MSRYLLWSILDFRMVQSVGFYLGFNVAIA